MGREEQQRRLDQLNGEGLEVPEDATPLDFFTTVFRDAGQPMHRRMKAAAEAAQYVHPKLSVQAQLEKQDFAAILEERRRWWQSQQPKLLEAPKVIDAKPSPAEVSAEAMQKPLTTFRRR